MRRLTSIIFYRIFRTTIYSTVSLTFCSWIVQSSRYLWVLSYNSIGFEKFLKFTSYLSIDIITIILPISLSISAAFVYQRFNESNQLVAMQSAGFSPRRMLTPLINLIAIVVCYMYASNIFISPYAWREFRSLEFNMKNNFTPPEKSGVVFSNDGFSIYAQNYAGNFVFKKIFIIDTRISWKVCSYFAKTGTVQNKVLILTDGERVEIDSQNHKNSIMHFQLYNCDLSKITKLEKKSLQPNEKYIDELLREESDLSTSTMQKALFHQKITSPFLALIFSLLSFFIILLAPYTRKHSSLRMIILIAIIVIFQGSYFWIVNAAARDLKFIKWNYILVTLSSIILIALIVKKRKL